LDRHCAYYSQFLAQRRDAFRKRGPGDTSVEMANIRAAWAWALEHGRVPEIRRSFEAIFWLLDLAGSQNCEKSALLAQAVDLLRGAEPTQENQLALGMALCCLADSLAMTGLRGAASPRAQEGLSLLRRLGTGRMLALGHNLAVLGGVAKDEAQTRHLLERGLAIAQEADEPLEAGWAHNSLGCIALSRDQYDEAEQHFLAFLRIAKEIEHRRGEAKSLGNLGKVAYLRGQYARARALHEQSLAIVRQLGERMYTVIRLDSLGEVGLALGDLDRARTRYREALLLAEEMVDLEYVASAHSGLGAVALAAEDVPAARRRYRRALEVALEDPRVDTGRETLVSLAKLYAHVGERERAVELVTLAHSVPTGFWRETLLGTSALLEELRSGLSPEAYAAAQERGRARDLETTMVELLAELEG
jgi:tetratricopeptide (TPR) repeat protein